jgi:hypothetical protein
MPRPFPMQAPWLALVLTLGTGCRNPPEPSIEKTPPAEPEALTGQTPEFERQTLRAADLEIDVPKTWQLLPESDPRFALAFDPTHKQPSACWIELRRQGLGPLPVGIRAIDEGPRRRGYMRGVVRGIIQETPMTDGSTLVVHCRARRSDTKLWATVIEPVLASQRDAELVVLEPPKDASEPAIVELCSAGPIVPGYVCALRADGAVYCGPTDGALGRVVTPAAVEIGCRGQVACARASSGEVECWSAGEPAQPQPSLGKARSITDACVVAEQGDVQCLSARKREGAKLHDLIVTPLQAFEDVNLAITRARVLMPGSTSEQGCVVGDSGVVCWDELGDLPVRFTSPAIASDEATGRRQQAPESIDGRTDVDELRRIGDRLCTHVGTQPWRCTEASGEVHELVGCGATQPCGCSLLGGNQMSCEDETEPRIDALPQGRIADVVGIAEPCAALVDGSVVCRATGSMQMRTVELRED